MSKPLIAVTMGDPAGVGPEVCLQLLANDSVREIATPVIFGDARLLARCARQSGLPAPKRIISEIEKPLYQLILEQRYLCCHSWARISEELEYDQRYLLRLHNEALTAAEELMQKRNFGKE